MAHTYKPITTADNTFTPVSDVTPNGTVEEKLTWTYINPTFDTWLELLAKEHWADWYFGTTFTDAWDSLIAPSRTYTPITTPDKTYTSVTTPSVSYGDVSDVTPDGVIEEKLTWVYIDDEFDTWLELLAKEHWCDWYFGATWVDDWASLIKSDNVYNEVTKSDNVFTNVSLIEGRNNSIWNYWYDMNLLTWNNMHSTGKTKWNDWIYEYEYNKTTTPSKTYNTITAPSTNYSEVTV